VDTNTHNTHNKIRRQTKSSELLVGDQLALLQVLKAFISQALMEKKIQGRDGGRGWGTKGKG